MKNGFLLLCLLMFLWACEKDDTVLPTVFVTEIAAPVDAEINDMVFIDNTTGFAVTEKGQLLQTVDGGATWEVKHTASFNGFMLRKIEFPAPATGFIYAETTTDGAIFKTADGGKNWTKLNTRDVEDFNFPTKDVGYYITSTYQYKTTNGGSSWSMMDNFPASASGHKVAFATKDTGYIVDSEFKYYQTTNGGNTWEQFYTPARGARKFEFYPTRGFAVGGDGNIFKTTNRGTTWNEVSIPNNQPFTFLDVAVKGATGFVVGDKSILISRDGGDTWKYVYNQFGINQQETFTAVHAIDDNSAIASGERGSFYKIEISR